jgi:hypothetical protein
MFYFLSRPRRFGKSLLVSTLEALFLAERPLFDGLWVAQDGCWQWRRHPVVVLDFNGIPGSTPQKLERSLSRRLRQIAKLYAVSLGSEDIEFQFQDLLLALHEKTGMPVVVLVDEYDKPLIDHLGKGKDALAIAKANREILKNFFSVLKDEMVAGSLRFVFFTGVSRFSKVSVFSELNNLDDISMSGAYAGMLGYTQQELETYFPEYLEDFVEKSGWSPEHTLTQLTRYYNGYRFSEDPLAVYNPFSILKAFSETQCKNYWFETGTPAFLIDVLQEQRYQVPSIEEVRVSQSTFTAFDIERLAPEAVLFQTGYLTIAKVQNGVYTLGYPNQEVKTAFSESLLFAYAHGMPRTTSSHVLQLASMLQRGEFDEFFTIMTAIFASIPYDLEAKRDEAYFHTIFYLLMAASGAGTQSSVLTCRGRIDLIVEFPERTYIIEFKCNQNAETAIQQIYARGYAEKYQHRGKLITLVGINFDTAQRNIREWDVVRLEDASAVSS